MSDRWTFGVEPLGQTRDAAALMRRVTGLLLSLVVVCILLFTGWKGWNLVYWYRVGVADR